MTDILDAVRQSTGIRGAGFLENDNQRINLRSEGQLLNVDDLKNTTVASVAGAPVRLKEVADVKEGPEPKFGDALIDGKPGVLLIAFRQLEADTLDVTRRLETEFDRLQPALERQGITCHPGLFRQAEFIEHAVGNVTHSLAIG